MDQPQTVGRRPADDLIGLFGCFVAAWLIVTLIQSCQKKNQAVPDDPAGPRAPLVEELPDLIGRLRRTASSCVSRAAAAKETLAGSRREDASLANGRRLYDEARAEHDACISDIQVALVRRFVESDRPRIARELRGAEDRAAAFLRWSNDTTERAVIGDAVADDALSFLTAWLEDAGKRNDEALKIIHENLERCRMMPWSDIHP